jgi:GntR family transcriptional regulator / MocR family aminotransferase
MSIEWSGLGPDLLVRLDRSRPEPLQAQLQHELREAIRAGRLAVGERLPSSRVLARELRVSRGLVLESYAQLTAEGFLSARGGSATRVAGGAHEPPTPKPTTAPPAPRLEIDFRPGRPDLQSFPRRDWLWALRDAARTAPDSAFGYGDPQGMERLREVLAGYVRRVRGAQTDPDRIVICAGFAQGQNLVMRALARAGAREIACEDPGDPDVIGDAARWSLVAVPVPIDERGIDVGALTATNAPAVLLTPAHQFPTGVVLAPERRQALVHWASEHDGTILEDDYDAEFRYDRDPVGLLQGLAPDRVAAIGTVSKALAPALRIGWIVSPPHVIDAIVEEKEIDDRGSPALDQLALARLIESGRFDRHLRHMRLVYGRRRRALIEALAEHAPDAHLSGLAAGFHAVLRLPAGADERAIAAEAHDRSVGLYPMADYRIGTAAGPPALVLGFGTLTEQAIARGIMRVADLLQP